MYRTICILRAYYVVCLAWLAFFYYYGIKDTDVQILC
jgi:hypothetical protein